MDPASFIYSGYAATHGRGGMEGEEEGKMMVKRRKRAGRQRRSRDSQKMYIYPFSVTFLFFS
jgi:hypothetical protein